MKSEKSIKRIDLAGVWGGGWKGTGRGSGCCSATGQAPSVHICETECREGVLIASDSVVMCT